MVFFFPVGVEEAEVDRLPWVSITLAVLCVLAFMGTWVLPRNPQGVDPGELTALFRYFEAHPYLEPSPEFHARFLGKNADVLIANARAEYEQHSAIPSESTLQFEQAQLDKMIESAIASSDTSWLRKLALIPARGLGQVGWLAHMFLHFGWLHLLGNLFFFYLVGPLLEDVWGRPLFTGFYLVGGLVAAIAHAALDWGSPGMMVGASGAIAACIGAFTLRYATRKIRMAYFVWLNLRFMRRGTFLLPAWLWGGLWFGNEVLSYYLDDGSSGVAMMAHIGGFGFGFGAAYLLRVTGIEKKYIAPQLEKKVAWLRHPGLTEAEDALQRNDPAAAKAAFGRVLAEQPDNWEAQVSLAKVELQAGEVEPGMLRVARTFEQLLTKNLKDAVWHVAEELGPLLDAKRLRPMLAFRVASTLEEGPDGLHPLAEPLYVAAAAAGGQLGAKALLRAAKIRLDLQDQPELAAEYLRSVRANTSLSLAQTQQADELEARAQAATSNPALHQRRSGPRPTSIELPDEPMAPPDAPSALPDEPLAQTRPARPARPSRESLALPDEPLAALPEPSGEIEQFDAPSDATQIVDMSHELTGLHVVPPRIVPCRVAGLSGDVLSLESNAGKRATVQLGKILAIAVGSAPAPEGFDRLTTDLVMSWGGDGKGPTVLRMSSDEMGLDTLYPGMPATEALSELVRFLLQQSRAHALPDAQTLESGAFPSFPSEDALNRAFYGAIR